MIVTHQNPDWDAIVGVWLLKRFGGMENEPVEFVNTGNPDKEMLGAAVAVVDTGQKYDAAYYRFDHHHLPGKRANDTCATEQVYRSLLADAWITNNDDLKINHLEPLINLIFAGDTGRSEANASRELGIHALLSGFKASFRERGEFASDEAIMEYGFGLLDTLALRLKNQALASEELAEKTVYKSSDGLVWAIRHGSQGSSFAAFEEGARIVIFEGQPVEIEDGTTYPVGIMRAGEWQEPHCGQLIKEVLDNTEITGNFCDEIKSWFNHNAGFFSGRGTPKAPIFKPVEIDLVQLAVEIDTAWKR